MTAPRARADVAAVTLDGETVIHDHGRIHVLDPVATLVWRCADGEASVDEIAADLASAFPASRESVRRDVGAAVGMLTDLGLLVDADPTPAAPIDGVELLIDPPGSCVSCAERTWAMRQSYRAGHRVAVVGTNSPRADAVIRAALASHLVDTAAAADAEPPFFAVDIHDDPPGANPQRLHLLHRGDTIAARSRRPDRIVRALVGHLASYGDLGALGLAAVNGLVVGRGDQAWIVAQPRDPLRFRRALGERDVLVADLPVALVDRATGEVVVGAPGLDVDVTAIDALAATEPARIEPDPLPWGRYRVIALGVDGPPSPTAALLALGPIADDHRDEDETFDALLALLEAVPVRDGVDPDGIRDLLEYE